MCSKFSEDVTLCVTFIFARIEGYRYIKTYRKEKLQLFHCRECFHVGVSRHGKNTTQFKPYHHLIAKKRGRFEFEEQPTIIDYET